MKGRKLGVLLLLLTMMVACNTGQSAEECFEENAEDCRGLGPQEMDSCLGFVYDDCNQ